MIKTTVHIILFVFTSFLSAYAQDIINPDFDKKVSGMIGFQVPTISVEKACNDSLQGYIYLDAREKEEYNISHIPEARYIGYDNFDHSTIADIPKDKPLIVYCSIGYRSDKIGEKLEKAGFTNVHNLYGSIFEWANRGFLIVDNKNQPTKRLHTYSKKWSRWVDNPDIEKVW